jgi:hypothetical protein
MLPIDAYSKKGAKLKTSVTGSGEQFVGDVECAVGALGASVACEELEPVLQGGEGDQADLSNGLTCKVTATNKNGKAAAVSNTLIVPVPPLPLLAPIVELPASKLVVSGGSVRVPLLCVGATCTGTIELSGQIVVKHRKGRRTISKKQTVLLAKRAYSLAAGSSATIAIRLTAMAPNTTTIEGGPDRTTPTRIAALRLRLSYAKRAEQGGEFP